MYMHSPSLGRHNCVCLCREIAISDARAMRKAGKALNPDSRYVCIYIHTCIYVLVGICADRTLRGVVHSPTMGCDRSDASNRLHNRLHSQRRKAANMASNLLRVANNSEIDKTSKMTTGMNGF